MKVLQEYKSLRYTANYYLDTRIRFFPERSNDPTKPKPQQAYITCYIADGTSIDGIIYDVTEAMDPNYRIFIGNLYIFLDITEKSKI